MKPVRSPVMSRTMPMDALLANSGWVRGLALSLVRDEQGADDLVQDMWLRALESPPTRAETSGGWLATVLRNLARDGWRKDGRRTARESAAARPEALPAAADLIARAEAHRSLIEHVTGLREPYRSVVLLRFFEDLPPREIAHRMDVPPATVRTHLHRALRMLRASLDGAPDGRNGWALALLPLPGSEFLKAAALTHGGGPSSALIGGLLVTTKQKLAMAITLLLFVGGGAAWVAASGIADEQPHVAATADTSEEGAPESERQRVERPKTAPVATAEATEEPEELSPDVAATPARPQQRERLDFTVLRYVERRPVPKGYTELKPGEEPEILDVGQGTSFGGGPQLLPYWSRWAPIPEKGTVTLQGRITDASGRGLEGADVYRVKLDENGERSSPSSYQWIEDIAKTDQNGYLVADAQPEGDFLIAADFRATMRSRRGLDVTPAVPVNIATDQTVRGVDVQLPIESARLATVEFTVVNEKGDPQRNAEVWSSVERIYTDKDGRALLGGLRPGVTPITIRSAGYASQKFDVDLQPGAEDEVRVQLEFAERGDLALEGRVIDEEGRPVPGAKLFLGASRMGSRYGTADENGVFRFEEMSRKYAETEVQIMVMSHPDRDRFRALGPPISTTVPAPGLELVVRRIARLRVLIRDEKTGDPLPLYSLSTEVLTTINGETEWRTQQGMSVYDETGEAEFGVAKGKVRLTIRAKDHRGVPIEVDIPDALENREILVALKRETDADDE